MSHKHLFLQPQNQTTLTADWNTTFRVGQDNEEIHLAQKTALADRELRGKQKRELQPPSTRVVTVSPRTGIEMSEITHKEYAIINGDNIESSDSVFD